MMKKILSLAMSCVLLAQSFGGTVSCKPSKSYKQVSITENNHQNGGFWDNHPGLAKFLKVAGTTAGWLVGADLLKSCAKELYFVARCDFLSNHPEKLSEDLTKIDEQTIERQQGASWCWNACLTRALFKQGLKDIDQKKVYRAMGGSRWWISPFKANRGQGAQWISKDELPSVLVTIVKLLANPVYLDEIESGVDKLSNGRLRHQTINLPWKKLKLDKSNLSKSDKLYASKAVVKVLRNILNRLRQDNKDAILVTWCPFGGCYHAVTVEDIDDKQVIFGEPTSGLMLGLPCDKYFCTEKSTLRDEISKNSFVYAAGMSINFVVERGKEIGEQWAQKMIDDVVKEVEAEMYRTYAA